MPGNENGSGGAVVVRVKVAEGVGDDNLWSVFDEDR